MSTQPTTNAITDLLTTKQAADALGLRHAAVRHAIMRGRLTPIRLHPKLTLLDPKDVEHYRQTYLGTRGHKTRRARAPHVRGHDTPKEQT